MGKGLFRCLVGATDHALWREILIERMLALEEYTRKTSLTRVLLVIIGTPLPTIILVLCQESIPLQNPSDSWSVNYGFWIRMVTLAVGEACGTVIQTGRLLDGVSLSPTQMVIFGICVATGNTAASMVVAAYWVFPIPFASFLLSPVVVAFSVGAFRLFAGGERCRQILSQREHLYRWFSYFSVQMVMVLIYPAYQALFEAVSYTKLEVPVLLLLPVLKLVLKNMLTFTLLHKEDMIPEQVIFTVDFFDAFYLAMCMKNVSSIITVVAIMAIDLVQACIEMQEVHQRTRSILKRLHRALGTKTEDRDLLANIRLLSSCIGENLHSQPCTGIQVRSCISRNISPEVEMLLKNMNFHQSIGSIENSFNLSRSIVHESARRLSLMSISGRVSRNVSRALSFQAKVAAAPATFELTVLPTSRNEVQESMDSNLDILRESLEVLFTNECIVLTEYLESIVPMRIICS